MNSESAPYLVGIGPWLIIPNEPRHNTFHMELHRVAPSEKINLRYFGLSEMQKQIWIMQALPNSILRKYVSISPRMLSDISKKLSNFTAEHKTIYIFEGSISWFITLWLLSLKSENTTFICNLFSSGKYDQLLFSNTPKSFFFRMAIRAISKAGAKKALITFDTKLMSDKVQDALGIKTEAFPVPSSFDFKARDENTSRHSRVLINLRGFDVSKLHGYFQASCQECRFVIPKGPISSGIVTLEEFGVYPNLEFDKSNISESEYASYIDSFDYLLILYEPSINASGKILDAITRGVPVAVPHGATEWAEISRNWGKANLYRWGNHDDEIKLFQHPTFTDPIYEGEPPFSPRNSIKTLARISKTLDSKGSNEPIFQVTTFYLLSPLYYLICTILNYQHSIRTRMLSFLPSRIKGVI